MQFEGVVNGAEKPRNQPETKRQNRPKAVCARIRRFDNSFLAHSELAAKWFKKQDRLFNSGL